MEPTEATAPVSTATSGAYRNASKQFEFTGDAGDYFGIWIVNIMLTIVTLGIYSAWAKVRDKQYFYGNTKLDGHAFRYTAEPLQILKGRVIAVILFAIYYFSGLLSPVAAAITVVLLMLLVPAFVVMSMSFQLRNTAYKNIRFSFDKNFKRSYYIFTLPVLVVGTYFAMITLISPSPDAATDQQMAEPAFGITVAILAFVIMLMYPWWEYLLTHFKITHSDFGTADLGFAASKGDYYKMYLKAFLTLFIFGIFLAVFIPMLANYTTGQTAAAEPGGFAIVVTTLLPFLFILLYFWMFAFIQTVRTNLIYDNLSVDGHQTQSDLKVGYMMYLYVTNTLAMAFSFGMMTPWAKIRTARYRARMTRILPSGDFDSFIGKQVEEQSAFGEEMGEVFDLDLGM